MRSLSKPRLSILNSSAPWTVRIDVSVAKRLAVAITLADGMMAGTRANRACLHMDRGSGRISVVTA
jgi:hypothetical protein